MEQQNPKEEIEEIMTEALFKFSIKCLRKYMKFNPKSDYAFSPYNMYEGLFLAYLTSSGVIEQHLKDILFLTKVPKCDLRGTFNFDKYNETEMSAEETASVVTCNYENESMCFIRKSKLSENPSSMEEIFNSGFVILDDNTNANINQINEKIQCQTKNYFRNPEKLTAIGENMDIALITVLRFNIQQFILTAYQSDASRASIDPNKRMCQGILYEELGTLVAKFPYKNGNMTLFALVPVFLSSSHGNKFEIDTSNTAVCDLIERLSTDEGMHKLRKLLDNNATLRMVKNFLSCPVFDLEQNLKICSLLQALGAPELTMSNPIDLDKSLFVKGEHKVQYGNVVHRVRVKITEDDTVASAMTLITGQKSLSNTKLNKISSNYSFVWLIYDKWHRNILFVGAFNKLK